MPWRAVITATASMEALTVGLADALAFRLVTSTAPPDELFDDASASLRENAWMLTLPPESMTPPPPAFTVDVVVALTDEVDTEINPPPLAAEPAVERSLAWASTVTLPALWPGAEPTIEPWASASVVADTSAVGSLLPTFSSSPMPRLLMLASPRLSANALTDTPPPLARTVASGSIAARVVFSSRVAIVVRPMSIAETEAVSALPTPEVVESASSDR